MNGFVKKEQSSRQNGNSVFYRRLFGIRYFGLKVTAFAACLLSIWLLNGIGISCVWRTVLGIPCPGCGMTRAYLALLFGDIVGAFRWHFMFPSVPVLALYILYDDRLLVKKRHRVILGLVLVGFAVQWVLRLTYGF